MDKSMKKLLLIGLIVLPFMLSASTISPEIQKFINLFNEVLGEKNAKIAELEQKIEEIEGSCGYKETETLTLINEYGFKYTFQDPIINRERIQDLVDVGFVPFQSNWPDWVYRTE